MYDRGGLLLALLAATQCEHSIAQTSMGQRVICVRTALRMIGAGLVLHALAMGLRCEWEPALEWGLALASAIAFAFAFEFALEPEPEWALCELTRMLRASFECLLSGARPSMRAQDVTHTRSWVAALERPLA